MAVEFQIHKVPFYHSTTKLILSTRALLSSNTMNCFKKCLVASFWRPLFCAPWKSREEAVQWLPLADILIFAKRRKLWRELKQISFFSKYENWYSLSVFSTCKKHGHLQSLTLHPCIYHASIYLIIQKNMRETYDIRSILFLRSEQNDLETDSVQLQFNFFYLSRKNKKLRNKTPRDDCQNRLTTPTPFAFQISFSLTGSRVVLRRLLKTKFILVSFYPTTRAVRRTSTCCKNNQSSKYSTVLHFEPWIIHMNLSHSTTI